jgi:predicted secreted Zn-dependent protease
MSQLVWQKSSFSGGGEGECVEVAAGPDGLIHVRESDEPDVIAVTTPAKWAAFVKGVKAGEFDHFGA